VVSSTTLFITGMIPGFSIFHSLRVSIRLSSCVLCFSWSDHLVFGVQLTHLSSPLLSHCVSHAFLHAKYLIPPVIFQHPFFQVQSSSRFPLRHTGIRSVRSLFFLCDRRIALSCSGYSTLACLVPIYENGDL
jgi:hypothetical protein